MTTPHSDPGGPSRPAPPKRPARPSTFRSGYPRVRAAVWLSALVCGGLVLVLVFFATIGVVDFSEAPVVGIAALAMALFFIVTMWGFSRSATGARPTANAAASSRRRHSVAFRRLREERPG